ncbi:isocitrate lyase [Methylacidimicrobium cyclopophantes]|uniref:Isocitrate lyase n=1 Tax=Methylacidimicrobium cyclopophantes TaxID=1041766 RepID=A0A5E6MA55_9BACT|nr:isocitrate lyase [Methylacidimicrobium cyclopophantes]VVM05189.1 isocitrate lyase [Methylacidimicrobium cyclopophantes]
MKEEERVKQIGEEWNTNPRWKGIERTYSAEAVVRLSGSLRIEQTLARRGAETLWKLLQTERFVGALGCLTGNQAVQQAKAGQKAIYLSGWQVAADANEAETMYPDQSLYPANSGPRLIRRINNALKRADEIAWMEGDHRIDFFLPIVADGEAGFGGVLNAFELAKEMIAAGVAGIHLEDQLASAKKCGHMGGKVLVPTQEAIAKLLAARLAADICDVPTVLIGRTDADSASLITSDIDPRDHPFLTGERTSEGFFRVRAGIEQAIARALSYAPYVDLLWCESSKPDLAQAKQFAEAVHAKFPGKLLAYNCSPSFHWKRQLDKTAIAHFQDDLAEMGYRFQFITLAGFHVLNYSMFHLAKEYSRRHMAAYVELQEAEFAAEKEGYTATRHQREVGAGYFDLVNMTIHGSSSATSALSGSTETEQFS